VVLVEAVLVEIIVLLLREVLAVYLAVAVAVAARHCQELQAQVAQAVRVVL
jgi:hypothetical protein